MRIEFDPKKAASNLKKHSVSFQEAASCLLDPHSRVRSDPDALDESRLILLGMSHAGRMLVVCYTLRGDEVIRLISARKATKKEVMSYA
jgi:uncharacterized DUF497 family protein